MKTLEGWVLIGSVDPEAFIEKNFKFAKDWENNINILISKKRELEKMLDVHKIECFNVTISPFKQSVEELIQKNVEILLRTLKVSIKKDKEILDQFLGKAMEKLTAKPQTVAEIGEAKNAALEINNQKEEMKKMYVECEERNKILRQVGGQNVKITEMESRWHNLEITLAAFSATIEEQKNLVRQEIDSRVKGINNDVEKFYSRWSALKPKEIDEIDR